MKSKNLTIIIKPTHNCNLRCKYCYIDENAENGMMNYETLKKSIFQPMKYIGKNGKVKYLWHGGEPLLAGIDFYKKVIEFQNEAKNETGCNYDNSLQSNITLLNTEYIDFFKNNNFSVGSSVDGPCEIHDCQRVYMNNKGSLEDVLKKIELAKENNFKIGTIAVITKNTLNYMDQFYEFIKNNDLGAKINVLLPTGRAEKNIKELGLTPKEYANFMIYLFDKWINDISAPQHMSCTLEEFIKNLIANSGSTCDYSGNCQNNFVAIGPLGDIYPCGRFDGLEEFKYGNINEENGFEKAMESETRKKLLNRKRSIECEPCEIKDLCNSGCMHNAYLNGDIFGKDYFCVSRKMIYSHVKKFLLEQLENAEEK